MKKLKLEELGRISVDQFKKKYFLPALLAYLHIAKYKKQHWGQRSQ
jgi:hypothetical protein